MLFDGSQPFDPGALKSECIRFAQQYLSEGRTIVPIRRGTKQPLTQYPIEATDLMRLIENAEVGGIGMIAGSHSRNEFVLDFDTDAAYEFFAKMAPTLSNTRTVRTAHGYHLHYLADNRNEHLKSAYWGSNGIAEYRNAGKVDILGEGSLVVMPPSVHPTGTRYTFENDCPPQIVQFTYVMEVLRRCHLLPGAMRSEACTELL